MTLQRWGTTMAVFGISLGLFSYCVAYVQSAWGLLILLFVHVMGFRAFVDTVDLCCGRLIRGETQQPVPVVRQVGTIRRVILEEEAVYEEH